MDRKEVNTPKMKLLKKGQSLNLNSIPAIGFAIGVGAVIISVLSLVTVEIKSQISSSAGPNSTAVMVAGNGTESLINLTGQLPLIGTIAGLVIVVGLVVAAFRLRG